MLPERLVLSKIQDAAMRSAAETTFPDECCGLLAGTGESCLTITEVVAAANIAADARHQFTVDPQVQFDLLRRLRGTSERVVGHYHSHPNGSARLSPRDLDEANDPNAIWVVIALDATGRALSPVAFRRPSGQDPVELEVVILS